MQFSEVEWRLDPLANCHNIDTFWEFMIQAGEWCCMLVPSDLKGPILWRLLKVYLCNQTTFVSLADGMLRWVSLIGENMMSGYIR